LRNWGEEIRKREKRKWNFVYMDDLYEERYHSSFFKSVANGSFVGERGEDYDVMLFLCCWY